MKASMGVSTPERETSMDLSVEGDLARRTLYDEKCVVAKTELGGLALGLAGFFEWMAPVAPPEIELKIWRKELEGVGFHCLHTVSVGASAEEGWEFRLADPVTFSAIEKILAEIKRAYLDNPIAVIDQTHEAERMPHKFRGKEVRLICFSRPKTCSLSSGGRRQCLGRERERQSRCWCRGLRRWRSRRAMT